MGAYCGCFSSSVSRVPLVNSFWVLASRSDLPHSHVTITAHLPELRESRNFSELSQVQLHGARHLLHGLDLGSRTHTRDRQTHVDGRPDALVEELALQEDLPVRDRDDVGRNVRRHISRLRLDDRQRREAAAPVLVRQLRRPLEQPAVQVEDVTRVGLPSRRPPQQQRHLPVRRGLLRQIVVYDDRVPPRVPEPLAHGTAGEGGQELQRRRVRGGGRDDDGVLERVLVLQRLHDARHRRALLADGDVDAVHAVLLLLGVVELLLVQNRVHRQRRFSRLPVADDQLALPPAYRHQGVHALDPRRHGLVHAPPVDDARRRHLHSVPQLRLDRPLAVDGVSQRVQHAAQQLRSHRHVDDTVGAADVVSLQDGPVVAEDDHTDVVCLQVQRHSRNSAREHDEFSHFDVLESVDTGDTVAHCDDVAHVHHVLLLIPSRDSALQQFGHFRWRDFRRGEAASLRCVRRAPCERRGQRPDQWSSQCFHVSGIKIGRWSTAELIVPSAAPGYRGRCFPIPSLRGRLVVYVRAFGRCLIILLVPFYITKPCVYIGYVIASESGLCHCLLLRECDGTNYSRCNSYT
ncbi:uncharacterized protein BcabD6B2_16660 [Babesia caballi]|uniref:Uncharacterized protein n=1 Tax=Babesia caballi TaxID=5871 RepID=A0AAV4LT36_BABCB|nr:hypothetical protein BcabD6B2_16660 [Babesia caballi]